MAEKNITVELAGPERKYVRTFLDFLDNTFLTADEQMVFIVLKSYVDFSADSGEAFPGIHTICKRSKLSESSVRRTINSLVKKGIVKKVRRGLTKTNLYILADYPAMWGCDDLGSLKEIVKNQGMVPLTPEEHIAELEKMGYRVEIKEKGPDTEPTKEQNQAPDNFYNVSGRKDTINDPESQAERYTMEDIRALFEYSGLIIRYPEKQTDIDIVFDILYDTLNCTKKSVRIGGEDRPCMAVISKIMKLQPDDLIYSIDRFHGQTDRIRNVRSYLLAILYNSREQQHLDLMNLGHHNGDF